MIVIVGAGIAGLSLAWELVGRGEDVTVLEANTTASGASGIATSYLEPRPGKTPLRLIEQEATRLWPNYAASLEAASGIDVEFRNGGQLRVTLEENRAKFDRDITTRAEQGLPVTPVTTSEIEELEPALSNEIVAGALLEDVAWVTGQKVCESLAEAIGRSGGVIRENTRVTRVQRLDETMLLSTGDGDEIRTTKLVLCTGGEAASIDGLSSDIPISRVVRGVNLVVDQSGLSSSISHLIKHHRGNLCPRPNGRLIVGTTYEPDQYSLEPDAEVVEKLYGNAEPVFPGLRSLPLIAVTAGLRSKVGDGLLRLGQSAECPGIYYSLSHAGAGYLRAPVVAREFAGYVLEGDVTGLNGLI